ncbi:glucose-6-phosphate isomerase [Maricaulis virginensis]|uniref:Glucose-6-phosphate isomerase n=1 Tax=Maricaulis virginensis TaxID=144022 RepID=A0A9W6IL24_9PROT|nr:glucose-6-phosphate isomerase [Maricaulis virginensis]GLK51938.1 glucose-6-phosphate isomerase [Maricaulis virginensis]
MVLTSDLAAHAERLGKVSLRTLADSGETRSNRLLARAAGIEFDASKQRLDEAALNALFKAAREAGLEEQRDKLLSGGVVNPTEDRPALHMAYRHGARISGTPEAELVDRTQAQTRAFAETVRSGDYAPSALPIARVINIGIGGSDLGPRLVADALSDLAGDGPELRFVASLDPSDLKQAVSGAEPEAILFVVASKSFSTQETLMSAEAARDWLEGHVGPERAGAHFVAASAAPDKARAFGIAPEHVFDFPDWVGGRYSVWSAVGLALEIGLGPDLFEDFRAGARDMDAHFAVAPLEENIPVLKGLIDVWNRVALGYPSRCVAAYSARLGKLADYFQQLEMESLGKSVTLDNRPGPTPGGALVWGGNGTEIQHSFFQWLHQGRDVVPVDFIGIARHFASSDPRERALAANMAAQGAALLDGRQVDPEAEPLLAAHKSMPGGRPSNTLLLDDLSARTLGALIALHEHKVFVESVMYEINPFDQWGVELGKVLTKGILDGEISEYDASTRALLARTGLIQD